MIYVVEAVKGGVGKSTTSVYLGHALARGGRRVLVVDADPQGTALEWEAAAASGGQPFDIDVEGLPSAVMIRRRLSGLAEHYDDTLIDCPNRDVGIIEAALAVSDLAVVPMVAGVEELRRVEAARNLATRADVPARVLLCLADQRTTLTREVLALLDAEGVDRFATVIRRRADIAVTVGAVRPEALHDYSALAVELLEAHHGSPTPA